MQLEINPPDIEPEYLRCLNECFPGWGNAEMAEWVFHRALPPNPQPDLLLLRKDGEPMAGSAVSYRSVALPNGNLVRAGIMTGSWTLPVARGQGCFARMIEESAALTRQREGALLLAFVTEDNPSRRQLEKAGAALFPAFYLIARPDEHPPRRESGDELTLFASSEQILQSSISRWQNAKRTSTHIFYNTVEDWKKQMLGRPGMVEVRHDISGTFACIERAETTDRIHAWWAPSPAAELLLFRSLRANAIASGRKLFSFSTRAAFAEQCSAAGFGIKRGFLAVIVADWDRLGTLLEIKDPVPFTESTLLDPQSPWFLGEWNLQAGDRM